MPGLTIAGTGRYLPGRAYTNHDLARVLDTNDEWIRQRTGIVQRHYCPVGQGAADLALPACQEALASAGLEPRDIDFILFNTMTPDHLFPGSGTLVGARLGCAGVPALDFRAQCAAMLYSFQVADALLSRDGIRRILIVGAEAHAALMPWLDREILEGTTQRKPSPEAWELASRHRGWGVVFGDGAGAVVVERSEEQGTGVLAVDLHSDGNDAAQLCIPAGFRVGSYLGGGDPDSTLIHMQGREVFKQAVLRLPRSVEAVCETAGVRVNDVDWFIAHQANQRINDAVCERLGIRPETMPSNIERYGNTSAATIPILLDEMRRDGRLQRGQLICLLAFGAGFHWGSVLVRI